MSEPPEEYLHENKGSLLLPKPLQSSRSRGDIPRGPRLSFVTSDAKSGMHRLRFDMPRKVHYVDRFRAPISEDAFRLFFSGSQRNKVGMVKEQREKTDGQACSALFPCTVYEMLEDAEEEGFDSIVSWKLHGRAFAVHNKESFISTVMPK